MFIVNNKTDIQMIFENVIVVNKWITPDGTILQTKYPGEFVSHTDVDDNRFFVDQGHHGHHHISGDLTDCSLFYDDSHEEIRKYFSWKSYGKDGKQPGTWLVLKDMETEHIKNILLTQKHISATVVRQVFIDELNYRGVEHEFS